MTVLAITGARLYDGNGSRATDDAVVVAEEDRIRYAGPREGVRSLPAGSTVIDAEGRSLIAGLIDCHVHLCFSAEPDFAKVAEEMTPQSALDAATSNARKALLAGITTVRDLGGAYGSSLETARAVAQGRIPGPRVITAAEVLTVPGGHAHFIGREIGSTDEMVKAVRELAEAGATAIKLIATGGVLTPGIGAQQSAFSQEELDAAVAEAHALGLRVAAHAIGAEGIDAAVRAGVDSIEHGCFLGEPTIGAMIANPTWLVATLSAPDRISNGGDGVPDYAREKSAEVQVSHRASFRSAVESGARIASGTDAGTPFNEHGGLSYELRLMAESGMPLDRVLQSATREGAALLGLGDVGTIEPGRIADLVLLDGDPLADVGAYARPAVVIQGGSVIADRR